MPILVIGTGRGVPRPPVSTPLARKRRLARTAAVLVVVVVAGMSALVVACSSSGDVKADQPPSVAADRVAVVMQLPTTEADCVRKAFADDNALAAVLNREPSAHPAQATIDRFAAAMRRCVPAAVLADFAATSASSGLTLNDQQRRCVQAAVAGFNDAQRDLLVLGSVNDELVSTIGLAALIQEQITTPCQLDQSIGTVPSSTPPGTGTDGALVPPGGGVTLTR